MNTATLSTPVWFISSNYTTIKTASGQYTFQGVGIQEMTAAKAELEKRRARIDRNIAALESYLSGEAKCSPDALR